MTFPKICAVVVNWNGGELVQQCVASLTQHVGPPLEIIVVDNHSGDGSAAALRCRFPFITLIENETNEGFAQGANIGIGRALAQGAEFVYLLNNDLTVEPTAPMEMITVMQQDARIGIAGAKVVRQDDPTRLYCVWEEIRYNHVLTRSVGEWEIDRGQYDSIRDVDCVCGAAMMVRRDVFEQVGLFDPLYFAYHEQVDFCHRARQRGRRIVFVPRAVVRHYGEHSLRSRDALFLKTYLLRRNSVLFMKKHGDWWTWCRFLGWVALSLSGMCVVDLLRNRWVYSRARLQGFWDGFCGRVVDEDRLWQIRSSLTGGKG